jgi:hypothetical protein
MADYLHQLAHNKTRSNRSLVSPQVSDAWRQRMAEELNIRYVAPAEASDDPWQPVVYPRNEDFGGF